MTQGDAWIKATLEAARRAKRLTQAELADAAGIDRSLYNGLENGKRPMSPYYAEKLAKPLKMRPADLIPPPEPVDPAQEKTPLQRLEELEAAVNKLGPLTDLLGERVAALETRSQTSKQRSGSSGRKR